MRVWAYVVNTNCSIYGELGVLLTYFYLVLHIVCVCVSYALGIY